LNWINNYFNLCWLILNFLLYNQGNSYSSKFNLFCQSFALSSSFFSLPELNFTLWEEDLPLSILYCLPSCFYLYILRFSENAFIRNTYSLSKGISSITSNGFSPNCLTLFSDFSSCFSVLSLFFCICWMVCSTFQLYFRSPFLLAMSPKRRRFCFCPSSY
jgi:hypothetical protein